MAAVGTYNLNGGLAAVELYPRRGRHFHLYRGTLQAITGVSRCLYNCSTITVGTAASNVATVDANGQTMTLNSTFDRHSYGHLSGPGSLTVIDSVGGGTVVLGGSLWITRQLLQCHQHLHRRHAGSCPARWKW